MHDLTRHRRGAARWPRVLTLAVAATLVLAACAQAPMPPAPPAPPWRALGEPAVLLVGERHDADAHQALQRHIVEDLVGRGRLAALVLEMADAGRSTQGLAPQADEAAVQRALAWNDAGWPWARYGPVVMAAVRAGVPVLGGNLPRERMRETMRDASLDQRLDEASLQAQRQAVRDGHCGLLPEAQIAPMTRIQIARDLSMARTVEDARRDGRTVVLVTGAFHARRDLGVPRHARAPQAMQVLLLRSADVAPAASLAAAADLELVTPALPPRDDCAPLRQRSG